MGGGWGRMKQGDLLGGYINNLKKHNASDTRNSETV